MRRAYSWLVALRPVAVVVVPVEFVVDDAEVSSVKHMLIHV
jgi:hypothetical protein